MNDIDNGGQACSRCSETAARYQGHQWLCAKHYRFGQMRALAKRRGKAVPAHEELHGMKGTDLCCPDCGTQMNWLANDGQSTVASLQHYRDGSMAIVCRSCNTRHAFMPEDSYRDMPKDHKLCPTCETVKPLTDFWADASRSGPMKFKSDCKYCADASVKAWKEINRDRYNEYQRQYRAKRKAEGNPVCSGS